MKREGNSLKVLKIVLYVIFSACGLVLLKVGTSKRFEISLHNGSFLLEVNFILLLGMILYIASFITSLIIMKGMNLNIFYPVSAGLVYIIVCLLSRLVLQEEMNIRQLIGMSIILIGIIIMNIKK